MSALSHTVVIADDDTDVRLLLRVVFGHEADFEIVAEATTPEEAVKCSARLQPNVVVLDQEFRGYATGTETAPRLRELCPHSLIVMFSAYDDLRNDVHNLPFLDAFVLKTDVSSLPSTLRQLLSANN